MNSQKGRLPRLPFCELKDKILGEEYELSLVFVTDTASRALNEKHRRKRKVANVLAFPLGSDEGEIFIAPKKAAKDSVQFAMPPRRFLAYLFIHGLFHLKGLRHGSTMEKNEQRLLKEYKI